MVSRAVTQVDGVAQGCPGTLLRYQTGLYDESIHIRRQRAWLYPKRVCQFSRGNAIRIPARQQPEQGQPSRMTKRWKAAGDKFFHKS